MVFTSWEGLSGRLLLWKERFMRSNGTYDKAFENERLIEKMDIFSCMRYNIFD